MAMRVPFAMTPGAAAYIKSRLRETETDRRPRLIRAFGYGDGLSDAIWYEGEHFHVTYEEKIAKDSVVVQLLGESVAIDHETLRRLTNRVLQLHTVTVERGETKNVLVSH